MKKEVLNFSYGFRNDVPVLNKFDTNGVSVFSFKKHGFDDRVSTLMLFYRKQSI